MLRRLTPLGFALALFAMGMSPLGAATAPASVPTSDRSPAGEISSAITTVTGIAISPLLGTAGYGAYRWVKATTAEQKAALPWFAKMSFWLPALLIVAVCAAKDAFGATLPPGVKKPLDVLETIENKFSGLVAAGAVVPFTMDAVSKVLVTDIPHSPLVGSGFAMIHLGAIQGSWLINLVTVPVGIVIFGMVWMCSHAINALILLSPWGAIDAALKSLRTAILGGLTLTGTINPVWGALLSVVIILVAWLLSGWAFRLMVFSTIFSWDFCTFRKTRFRPDGRQNRVFAGNRLRALKVPVRTYGRWISEPENGTWRFAYRPWLVLPERSVVVPVTTPYLGRGLFLSTIADNNLTLMILPPRYRGHEEALVQTYHIEGGIQDAGLLKAWSMIRELFGGVATRAQVV